LTSALLVVPGFLQADRDKDSAIASNSVASEPCDYDPIQPTGRFIDSPLVSRYHPDKQRDSGCGHGYDCRDADQFLASLL